jgi:hypothetical protein
MSRSVDAATLRARYEALLPKYGELWKSMAPREPLSLLTAIENGQTVSLKIPSCDCPFDGLCQGCAAPILELDDDASPSNSSSCSGDTTIGFDLSYIHLEENSSPNAAVNNSKSPEPATGTFRDAPNDESTFSSKNGSKCGPNYQESASSSGSSIQGYDLSHLRLDDDDDDESKKEDERSPAALVPRSEQPVESTASSKNESASSPSSSILESDLPFLRIEEDDESNQEDGSGPAALVSKRESPVESNDIMRNVDTSQVIDLLDDTDSEDEWITDGDSVMDKAIAIEDSPKANGETRNKIDSKPRARVEYLSDSSEEEWNENMFEDESVASQRMNPNRSPTVIVLSDSDDAITESRLYVNEESIDTSDNDALVDNTDTFARKPFARDTLLVDTIDTKPSPEQDKAPDKNKGESKAYFRKRREQRARTIFADFDRVAFSGALGKVELIWSNKLRTTAGLTRLKRKSGGGGGPPEHIATIELSTKIIDEEHRLRSTLLHEMCHAAAWLVDGVSKPPHGSCFKKWANTAMEKVREFHLLDMSITLCFQSHGIAQSLLFSTGARCDCHNNA